jgi:chromatin structure-remodeling complex subunit RSC9
MTQNPVARSTATLPHHSSHGIPRPAVYNPDPRELYPGPRNRLFLALKSTVPSEVDWALPRLVLASFDHAEAFKLETWIDSVAALQYWPERWLEELEKEATLLEVREGRVGAARDVLAVVPEWTKNQPIETRAVHSLLVLRNASFIGGNAKLICRAAFLAFVNRFFALPLPLLLNLSLRSPEPFAHILVILQSVLPYLGQYPNTQRILTITLPAVLVETRDVGMLHHIFPLIISALALPGLPPPPDSLTLHLLYLLTLTPPMSILELTLDLLVSLTLQPTHARQILALPGFPAHLRSLVILLEHSARQVPVSREAPPSTQGVLLRNPASEAILAEEASRRRTLERDVAARKMELFGGGGVAIEVGDKPPALSPSVRSALFAMGEPRRSITWCVSSKAFLPPNRCRVSC